MKFLDPNNPLHNFMKENFAKEMDRVKEGKCPFCGKEIDMNEFKDELSIREFKISGICQKCHDETFGEDEGED